MRQNQEDIMVSDLLKAYAYDFILFLVLAQMVHLLTKNVLKTF